MDIENLSGAELRFYTDPRDLDGEERYLVACIDSLRRQFEKDAKPYYDKLAAIRANQPPARFYLTSGQEYIPDPRRGTWRTCAVQTVPATPVDETAPPSRRLPDTW